IDGGSAVTVDCPAETAPAVTVTVAVAVTSTPLILADTVFGPAVVALSVPVATPLAFVGPVGWVSVVPPPLAASTTVAPSIGLPRASFAVTVFAARRLPALIDGGSAVTVDCAPETAPAVTVTVAVCVTSTPLILADTVLSPAVAAL